MPCSQWLRPPRHLLALFLAVTLIPATALAWLSWRLLEQDRALEGQRVQERLERAADLITAALERRLLEMTDQLPALPEPARDALAVTFSPDQVETHPPGRLLYYPTVPQAQEAPGRIFAAGEAFEFRELNYDRAIAAFRKLARSEDPLVRAGALVRLGRNLRKKKQAPGGTGRLRRARAARPDSCGRRSRGASGEAGALCPVA